MYIVKEPNTYIMALDDIGLTEYKNNDGTTRNVYMPKSVFIKSIPNLKGVDVKIEHKTHSEHKGFCGKVIDVVHNIEGIKAYDGTIKDPKKNPECAVWYAIIKVDKDKVAIINKMLSEHQRAGISTEYLKESLKDPSLFMKHFEEFDEEGMVNGTVPDEVACDVEYNGIAFVKEPKRAYTTQHNSKEEKKLDKQNTGILIDKTFNQTMSNEAIEKLTNSIEEIKDSVKGLHNTLPKIMNDSYSSYDKQKQEAIKNSQEKEEEKKGESWKEAINTLDKRLTKLETDLINNASKNSKEEDEEENSTEADEQEQNSKEEGYKSIGKKIKNGFNATQEHNSKEKKEFPFQSSIYSSQS